MLLSRAILGLCYTAESLLYWGSDLEAGHYLSSVARSQSGLQSILRNSYRLENDSQTFASLLWTVEMRVTQCRLSDANAPFIFLV